MKNTIYISLLAIFLFPSFSQARTIELYTLDGFLEVLTEKGLIAEEKRNLAHELVAMLEVSNSYRPSPLDISVRASQRIEYSDLTYTTGEDIEGLVLLVENNSDETASLWANHACPVTYEIYENDDMLFDSNNLERCESDTRGQFSLESRESRMFEVTHKQSDYALDAGEYRFVLSYRQYGKDEIEVTIQK